MTISNLTGNECGTEIAKKINDIIAQKATISLSNLDAAGEQRFTNLASDISDVNDLITALTTVVNGKLSAECLLQQNGYIKFSNGLLVSWLKTTKGTTVTYPVTYSEVPLIISGQISTDANYNVYASACINTTKTGFGATTGSGTGRTLCYLMIGY